MFAHSLHISIFEVPNIYKTGRNPKFINVLIYTPLCVWLYFLILSVLQVFGDTHTAGVFFIENVLNLHKMPNTCKNVLNANNSSIVDNSEILTYEFADTLKMLSLCIEDKAVENMQCLNNKKELEKNLSQIVAISRSINKSIDADEFQDLGDILKTLSNNYQNQH